MAYDEFFQKAKEKKITNIQITEKEGKSSTCEIINGKLESFDQNQEIQLVINIIRDLLVKEHLVQNDILILTPWDNSKFHKNYVIYKVEEILRKSGIQFCDFTDSKLTKDGIRIGTKNTGYLNLILSGIRFIFD